VKCDEPKEEKVQQEEQKVKDFTDPIALVPLLIFFGRRKQRGTTRGG
jgi:hypothetical protein